MYPDLCVVDLFILIEILGVHLQNEMEASLAEH